MIRVRIELCPFGDERPEAVKEIGRMYIANDGIRSRENRALGDYTVVVCKKGTTAVPRPISRPGPCPTRGGEVRDYPRLAHNIWRLIARALHVAFPEESAPAQRKAKDRPALDAAVMRGLAAAMEYATDLAAEHADPLTDDEQAAADWLDASNNDHKETQ